MKEEATSVSHRRIDRDDGDVPPGPEHVPLFVAAAATDDDRAAAVNGQGATQVGDVSVNSPGFTVKRWNVCTPGTPVRRPVQPYSDKL